MIEFFIVRTVPGVHADKPAWRGVLSLTLMAVLSCRSDTVAMPRHAGELSDR
jgi:hypothetical protein